MEKPRNNYAFIDGQNLNRGMQALGWKLDYRKFSVFLKEKYSVEKAFMFLGFIAANEELYESLRAAGFILIFRPIVIDREGRIKGNIDTDLVMNIMANWHQFQKAIIVSGDGDFYLLIKHLCEQEKLQTIVSPTAIRTSRLIQELIKDKIQYMDTMQKELEYEKPP